MAAPSSPDFQVRAHRVGHRLGLHRVLGSLSGYIPSENAQNSPTDIVLDGSLQGYVDLRFIQFY